MATPVLTAINLDTLADAESTTGWFGASVGLDNEVFIQGSNSIGGEFRSDLQTQGYANASAPSGVGKTFRGWWNFTFVSFLDTEANGGMEFFMGDGARQFKTVAGSDTYAGGWFYVVASTGQFTSLTAANIDEWGFRFNRTSQPRKLRNMYTDYFIYMDGYSITGGTSGDPVTLADVATTDRSNSYGVVQNVDGAFFCTGELQVGSGATATDFDMDGNVLIFTEQDVDANLYEFRARGSGLNIELKNSLFQSTGFSSDNTRFNFDLNDANITLSNSNCALQRANTVAFNSNQTINGWSFTNCNAVTTNGATLDACTFTNTNAVAACNVSNLDQVDGCTFIGNNSSHAVQLTQVPSNGVTMQWNCTADSSYTSGLPATVTTTNTDAHIFVTDTTSNNLTISVSAGATVPSVRLGAGYTGTVTVVSGQATLTITNVVTDSDVVIYTAGTTTKLQDDQDIAGTSSAYTYTFVASTFVDVKVYRDGYVPYFVYGFELGSANASLPVAQVLDRNYVP